MTFKLRDYQEEAIADLDRRLADGG